MRVNRVVAILVPWALAVAGCHLAPPVRPDGLQVSQSKSVANARTQLPTRSPRPNGDEPILLASLEQEQHLSASADSDGQSSLTLAALEEIAVQNNPTLAISVARFDAARGQRLQAGLYPNPVIGYHATEIGNQGTAGQQGGFISQRFVTAGKLRLDQAIAGKDVERSSFEFDVQRVRVLNEVKLRFYDAMVAQRRVQLTEELARISDDFASSSRKLLEGLQISDNDLLQAEIEAQQAHILLDNAHNENIESWRRLTAVIGIPTMPPAPLTGELEADVMHRDWDDCYAVVMEQNPELMAARTRVDRARLAITRAHRENIPNIDLMVSIRHVNPTDSDTASVQAGIPIPIFNKNQGNILQAQSEWIAAQNEIRRVELNLQDRLAVAYRRYENAYQQVKRYTDRILPPAKKSLDLVKSGYAAGQVEYLTLITSQRTFIRVNLAYLDSLRELREAAAILDGQVLSGGALDRPGVP